MVWVLTGHVQSEKDDPAGSVPRETSHWLRPSRFYTLGRGVFKFGFKDGKDRFTAAKCYDFRVNSTNVSGKEHLRIELGDWSEENVLDTPGSETNLEPYTLTIQSPKKLSVISHGVLTGTEENERVTLRSGDIVKYAGGGYNFRVEWVPYNLCLSTKITPRHREQARELGIKLAYKKFLPHHTHYLPAELSPSTSLCLAALHLTPVLNPKFLDAFYACGKCESPPTQDLPPPPNPGEELSSKTEAALLALNPSPGGDWTRWWGHSLLEIDWYGTWEGDELQADKLPVPPAEGFENLYSSAAWNPKEARRDLFENVLVISFAGEDSVISSLVTAGKGTFHFCDLVLKDATTRTVLDAIATFRKTAGISSDARVAIVPPSGCEWQQSSGESRAAIVSRQAAMSLGAQEYLDVTKLTQCIYDADTSIFTAPLNSQPNVLAPPSAPQSTANTMPISSFVSVPGTHPEEEVLHPVRRGGPAPKSTAGQNDGAAAEEAEAAPAPVRKPTRRARGGQPGSTLDSLFASTRTQPSYPNFDYSLDEARDEVEEEAAMPDEPVASTSQMAPPDLPKRAKRRAGATQEAALSMFEIAEAARVGKKPRVDAEDPKAESSKKKQSDLAAVREDTEEAATPGPSTSKRAGTDEAEGRANKKARTVSPEPGDSAVSPKRRPAAKGKVPVAPVKGAKGKGGKKADKPSAEEEAAEARILQLKTTKRKGGELDQQFNEEFNALRLVRPALTKMPAPQGVRISWDGEDAEDEMERLIHEDQDRLDRPEEWGGRSGGGMFQVHYVPMVRAERAPRNDAEVDEKYAGRPNFKKFRPKNSTAPRVASKPKDRPALVISEIGDLGLGNAYDSQKIVRKADNDFEAESGTQSRLNFGKAASKSSKTKGKGRAVVESDEDSDGDGDVFKFDDEVDGMDVDDDDRSVSLTPTIASGSNENNKRKAATSKKAPSKPAPVPAKRTARKAAPATLLLDDDSESDDGVTFKGFSKPAATGTKRKR